jgi:ABC-type Mn2+/Zn2+ transport system permease subunit
MSVFEVLLPAFVAGLVVTGMLAYLGVHVVERGVIFVDLSLAQIAALGTTVGVLAGYDVHSTMGYVFSLGFALCGAARLRAFPRAPQHADSTGGDHRHRLRGRRGGGDSHDVQGRRRDRAPEGDARR